VTPRRRRILAAPSFSTLAVSLEYETLRILAELIGCACLLSGYWLLTARVVGAGTWLSLIGVVLVGIAMVILRIWPVAIMEAVFAAVSIYRLVHNASS
jgi:hypothetical protein